VEDPLLAKNRYKADSDYALFRKWDDGTLAEEPSYYLQGEALYLDRQLRLFDPSERFEGTPAGLVERASRTPLQVLDGDIQVGLLEADSFTNCFGQQYQLVEIIL